MHDPSLASLLRTARRRLVAVALLAALALGALGLWLTRSWPLPGQLCAAALTLAVLGAWLETWWRRLSADGLARHLNRQLPELEDSAELLLKPVAPATPAARLPSRQRDRVSERLAAALREAPSQRLLPLRPLRELALRSLLLAALGVLPLGYRALAPEAAAPPLKWLDAELTIAPPAYTGRPSRSSATAGARAEQGSRVTWQLRFSASPEWAWIATDDGRELAARREGPGVLVVQTTLETDLVYTVHWQHAGTADAGEPQLLKVVRDQPPVLTVTQPERSPLEVDDASDERLKLRIEVTDDYALSDSTLAVTVAKGDGEGVKFRDLQLPFDRVDELDPTPEGDRRYHLQRHWDLPALDMGPGDELYFRALISDNREPERNVSRSQVFMIRWLSSDDRPTLSLEGLAVDILPEYFRSQRQIIIDTEKLLAEQDTVSAGEGLRRSRGLALDQKSLRLRYGQYLGEEFESDIGIALPPDFELEGEHANETFAEHLAHAGPGHDHGAGATSPAAGGGGPVATTIGGLPDFMADFVHAHDSAEQATLFDAKTRETLKAALAEMWQSELRLHLIQPQRALPYQYQALALLKQVQQANRIYVRRAGFEPPPLDVGRQLSGEADETRSSRSPWAASPEAADAQLLRRLRRELELGQASAETLAPLAPVLADDASARVALARLRGALAAGDDCRSCREILKAALWQRLPPPLASPSRLRAEPWGTLEAVYLGPLEEKP
ncbi:MAG: hypothetical protein AAGA23_22240 [Pseudomonadota bacterium]